MIPDWSLRVFILTAALTGAASTTMAQSVPSRAEMEALIVRQTYQQTCEEARAQGHKVVLATCVDHLMRTRGPAFVQKMRGFSDTRIQQLYQQYKTRM